MYRDKEVREKDIYREKEMYREKELTRERDVYREKEPYREREHYRERESYREGGNYKDPSRIRQVYREKDVFKDKEIQRDRDMFSNRDRQGRYGEAEAKTRTESGKIENRLRMLAEDNQSLQTNEKENRDKSSGDKELEDLRSRLLNKRISKELQDSKKHTDYIEKSSKSDKHYSLDKHQQERRNKLLEAGNLSHLN